MKRVRIEIENNVWVWLVIALTLGLLSLAIGDYALSNPLGDGIIRCRSSSTECKESSNFYAGTGDTIEIDYDVVISECPSTADQRYCNFVSNVTIGITKYPYGDIWSAKIESSEIDTVTVKVPDSGLYFVYVRTWLLEGDAEATVEWKVQRNSNNLLMIGLVCMLTLGVVLIGLGILVRRMNQLDSPSTSEVEKPPRA